MKALRIRDYGGPDALEIVDVPRPDPGPNDVVIEVHAASVNPIDWKIREGYMKAFVDIPMPHVMGRDVSGVVAAVGAELVAVEGAGREPVVEIFDRTEVVDLKLDAVAVGIGVVHRRRRPVIDRAPGYDANRLEPFEGAHQVGQGIVSIGDVVEADGSGDRGL